MDKRQAHIGVFDSGVGGVSVLRELVRELPHERFEYFGDSANAPYGSRSEEDVRRLSLLHVGHMVESGAKAVVIACNTATSAAAAALRERHPHVPIVGIEPALKPATLAKEHARILVMATQTTLELDKFQQLAREYGSDSQIFTQACPGLMDLVETGELESPAIDSLLHKLIGRYSSERIDSVVLGCTHYPFIKEHIARILGPVDFFDGAEGTARRLHSLLEERGELAPDTQEGGVHFASSTPGPAFAALCNRLFSI